MILALGCRDRIRGMRGDTDNPSVSSYRGTSQRTLRIINHNDPAVDRAIIPERFDCVVAQRANRLQVNGLQFCFVHSSKYSLSWSVSSISGGATPWRTLCILRLVMLKTCGWPSGTYLRGQRSAMTGRY